MNAKYNTVIFYIWPTNNEKIVFKIKNKFSYFLSVKWSSRQLEDYTAGKKQIYFGHSSNYEREDYKFVFFLKSTRREIEKRIDCWPKVVSTIQVTPNFMENWRLHCLGPKLKQGLPPPTPKNKHPPPLRKKKQYLYYWEGIIDIKNDN